MGIREKEKATVREKVRGKGNAGIAGKWATGRSSCKNATKKEKGEGYGQHGTWTIHFICGLKEAENNADGEGAAASSRGTTEVLARRSVPEVSGGSFALLQEEDEEDDDEEVPGFQSQASLYEEKKQKQKEHAEKEKDAKPVPPPPPKPQSDRPQKTNETKRVYMPMHKIEKKSECGCKVASSGVEPALCELGQNKNKQQMKRPKLFVRFKS